MRPISCIILAICIFSCRKSDNVPVVPGPPEDSVISVKTYPFTVNYSGTLKVNEMQAGHSPAEDVFFDTAYTTSLNVGYPDATTVTFQFNWWGVDSRGNRQLHRDFSHFAIDTGGVYFSKPYHYRISLKSDSLNIFINHSGGQSHTLEVKFAGIKAP